MADESQIRINALLLEREALFVRIHQLERAASALLGEPFPFTRPALPSDQRGKRKPASRPISSLKTPAAFQGVAGTSGATIAAVAEAGVFTNGKKELRKLEPEAGENAYRVTYRQLNQTQVETHDSTEALRTLLASQNANLQVLKIESLDAAGTVRATLFTTGV